MLFRYGRRTRVAARPLLLLLLVSSAARAYTTANRPISRSLTAMAASSTTTTTKPIVVVTGSNKGIGSVNTRRLGLKGLAYAISTSNQVNQSVSHLSTQPQHTRSYEILKKVAPASGVTVLAARNPQLGEAAAKQLREQEGLANVVFKPLDINAPESIQAFARAMQEEHGRVDVLVNNAGFAYKGRDPTPFREQAAPTLKTNYWGTAALIDAMVPLLRQSADPKIVNVASQSGRLSILDTDKAKQREVSSPGLTRERLDEMVREFQADVEAGTHAAKGWPNTCYGMSKLALIACGRVFAAEEAKRHPERPIWLASCCPGWCATDMSSHSGPRSAEHGARTPAWLALRGKEEGARSGGFFYDENEIAW
jgi:carbonyl reductase 1